MRRLLIATLVGVLLAGCFGASSSPSGTPSSSPEPTPSATATLSPTPWPEPSASGTPTPTASPTSTSVPSPSATASATAFVTYTVRAGDTLGSIASSHDTTWQSLVFWNQDRYPSLDPDSPAYDPNVIEVGWTLRLQPGVIVPFDAPPPSARPTPTPSARPTPTPPPSATGTLITNGSRTSTKVALTFDMGGRVGDALGIMTWLRDHDVKATIFMTGAMADSTATDAARLVLARVDARPDLFDLGNHSYSHPHMTTLSAAGMADEIRRAEAAIDRHATSSPRPFFRPPYGEWNTTLVNVAASAGYRFSIMWDVDTIDWNPISEGGPTAQQIVDKVVARAQGGSIVLMHLGGYETLKALPGIVNGLRARGFQLVTLGEMLGG